MTKTIRIYDAAGNELHHVVYVNNHRRISSAAALGQRKIDGLFRTGAARATLECNGCTVEFKFVNGVSQWVR